MQDPNADTEWNDALRKHGIIPEKKKEAEITEDEIIKMVEASVKAKSGVKDVEVRFLVVLIYLILNKEEFNKWSILFLPSLFDKSLQLNPGKIKDSSDGKPVHLVGLNFSRAWCLYSIDNPYADQLADIHIDYSLFTITGGDRAGQHWLASFALYAFKCQKE